MAMDRIENIFNSQERTFIPYITAGVPSAKETIDIMDVLVGNGADIIELGLPFSDPTADGPIIQKSSQHSLDQGFELQDYFSIIEGFRSQNQNTPIVVFSYFNPIFCYGIEPFFEKISSLGADAVLIVDLPYEEQSDVQVTLDKLDIHLIQLIAPTTPDSRAKLLLKNASGFVYQISLRGVTGSRKTMSGDVTSQIKRIRKLTELPIAIGFGISDVDQINLVKSLVDGIVIGSAVVDVIINNGLEYRDPLSKKIREFSEAIH